MNSLENGPFSGGQPPWFPRGNWHEDCKCASTETSTLTASGSTLQQLSIGIGRGGLHSSLVKSWKMLKGFRWLDVEYIWNWTWPARSWPAKLGSLLSASRGHILVAGAIGWLAICCNGHSPWWCPRMSVVQQSALHRFSQIFRASGASGLRWPLWPHRSWQLGPTSKCM